MSETTDARSLSVARHYDLPAEQVFDAFLDVETARRFLFATATGEMIDAKIDAKVGGRFTFTDRRPDMGDVLHTGEYLEIERPRRLVFTFAVPQFNPAYTTVTVEIAPSPGGCDLTLSHDGVPPEYAERNVEGWTRILAGLVPAMAGKTAAGWAS
jgi:uncharacterized protein YndB with AHSA1/START domain